MPRTITMKGSPLTLEGLELIVGQKAPDFALTANDLNLKTMKDYAGKALIIATVPSLDTGVCDMETRRFNSEIAGLSKEIKILTVSCDLPFAQARWCGAAGVDKLETLSDYRERSFGRAYGVLIKELMLLGRAVFVIDKNGKITYTQIVPELTKEPDYKAALDAAKAVA